MPAYVLLGLLTLSLLGYLLFLVQTLMRRPLPYDADAVPPRWHALHAFGVLLLFLVFAVDAQAGSQFVAAVLDRPTNGQFALAVQIVLMYVANGFTLFVIFSIAARSGAPRLMLGLSGPGAARSVYQGLVMFILFVPLEIAFPVVVDRLYEVFLHKTPPPQDALAAFLTADWPLVVLMTLAAVVVAPIFEELIFRGFIQRGFERTLGKPIAVAATAVIFASVHTGSAIGVKVLPLAIVLSVAYARSRNIVANMVFHSLFNASSLAVVLVARHAGLDFGVGYP